MNTIDQHRTREARIITTAITAVCGLGFAAAVVPGAEQRITAALVIGAAVLAALAAVRVVVRRVREHREDRADERIAAVLRAKYQARRAQQGAEDVVRGRA